MKPNRISTFIVCLLFLTSCATQPPDKVTLKPPDVDVKELAFKGVTEMRKGNYEKARTYLAQGLRYEPTNCHLNFLNAVSYQLEGRGGDSNQMRLAQVGYQIAMKFCPNDPWPYYFNGIIQLQGGAYAAAEQSFKMATMLANNTEIRNFMQDYLLAAYDAGDRAAASQIATKLAQIDPYNKLAKEVKSLVDKPALPNPMGVPVSSGNGQPVQGQFPTRYYDPLFKRKKPLRKQLIVDAVIILNREAVSTRRGLNLLNGLQLQYGSGDIPGLLATYNHTGTSEWGRYINASTVDGSFLGSFPQVPFSKLVTNVISVPAVTYDLNIFNNFDEQDEILARPTLVAEDGQTATYFSGRNLIVGIQGTLNGTIQTFPIGVDMKLTPYFLADGSINLDIMIGRELLIPTSESTTFQQTAEELSERTHTTVNVHYGETIILSALSETVQTQSSNRTPVLGSIPIIKYLFNERRKAEEQTSVLFLLTPQRYLSFAAPYTVPDERQLQHYFSTLIDPATNLNRVLKDLHVLQIYNTPVILVKSLYDAQTIAESLSDELSQIN